ncbi:MAG TPA: hypothetical protein VNT76_21315 [Candidatus Binatus sp.]|nr:hypothetical protein [Candidatus Binatus sp.]
MSDFSVIAPLDKAGVGWGQLTAYPTARSLFGLQRIIMLKIPFLSLKVVAIRLAVGVFFPFLAGWLSDLVWQNLNV